MPEQAEAPKPKSLPLPVLALGVLLILCTACLAVRIIWEMTSLTWQLGPQMVGFSLAHGYYAPLLFSPFLLGIWILISAIFILLWKLRHHTVSRATWITLTAGILVLGVLSIPQECYDRIFVDRLAASPKVNELLPYAAVEGHDSVTRALIAHGVPIDIRNRDGATALHAAAGTGQASLATFLLDHGADPNALTLYGDSPLQLATARNQTATIQILTARGGRLIKGTDEQREQATHDIVRHVIDEQNRTTGLTPQN